MMNRKHIALIHTGGTIGMARTGSGYAPAGAFTVELQRMLDEAGDSLPHCTIYSYDDPIDSTNATPCDWQRIGQDIVDRYELFDGFIVLHGTDTMAYTASALSFMLRGLRKPVILTGSQVPMSEVRSDARQNVVTALQLAAMGGIGEVAISFGQRLLRGNRATKTSAQRYAAFDSPNYPWLAETGINIRLERSALLPLPEKEEFELPAYSAGRIFSLRFVPGLPTRVVQSLLDLGPHALIMECYGAGNAPDRDPALYDILARATTKGVVLVATSQAAHGSVAIGTYAVSSGLAKAGVIGAGDMTFEAIYTKLHHLFALGLSPEAVKASMLRNISGELSGGTVV